MKPEQVFKTFEIQHIHEDSMRTAECWGSVEVKDRHNEIIPIEEVYKVMDIWMDRGAPIMFNHTHRQVGKGINWVPKDKDGKPGVLIKFKIYNHYAEDDEIWQGIKKGDFEGLSIGGKSYERENSEEGTILRKLIGYEFSVVERAGNQEATFVDFNALAKNNIKMSQEDIKKEETMVEKPEEEQKEDSNDMKVMIEALVEKLTALEARVDEISAGKPEEPEEAVEESKSEDEPEESSEEDEEVEKAESDEVTKKLESMENQITELTKMLKAKNTVKEVVETPRPQEVTKSDMESVRELYRGKGRVSFTEVGKKLREMNN